MPNALHQGSPRQLGLPQYSNWSVMSLFSLSNNLTFEKDLLPTSGKLCSKIVRNLDQRELPSVETLGPLVAPSLRSGRYSPGPSGFYRRVSVSNYYLGTKYEGSNVKGQRSTTGNVL